MPDSDAGRAEPADLDLAVLSELLSERAIHQQLNNYCRAMDRCDAELGRSVFHAGAIADYGAMYQGPAEGFVDFALSGHTHLETHVHRISNVSIAVRGDGAGSECYIDARFRSTQDGVTLERTSCGRFIDRWENRDGRWAIVERQYRHCLDTARPLDGNMFAPTGERDLSDLSYAVLAGSSS